MKLTYLISLWVLFFNSTSNAKFYIHPKKSIQSFWGEDVKIKENSLILNHNESSAAQKEAQLIFKNKLFRYYGVSNKHGKALGFALLLTRKVRTKTITLLVGLNNKKNIEFVETISFNEPQEYKPKKKWLKESFPKGLTPLELKANMSHISGATFSAQAIYASVKWALTLGPKLK